MLMEGVNLRLKLSRKGLRLQGEHRKKIKYLSYCIGWVVPSIIVAIAAGVGFQHSNYLQMMPKYQLYETCWLSKKSPYRIYAVLIPLALVVVINITIAVHAAVVVVKMRKKEKQLHVYVEQEESQELVKLNQIASGLKSVIILCPTFGLSWIFMFLTSKFIKLKAH